MVINILTEPLGPFAGIVSEKGKEGNFDSGL